VGHPQLQRDQHRSGEGGQADDVAASRHERDRHGEEGGTRLHHHLGGVPAVLAPDRERRAARGLEGDGAIEERV